MSKLLSSKKQKKKSQHKSRKFETLQARAVRFKASYSELQSPLFQKLYGLSPESSESIIEALSELKPAISDSIVTADEHAVLPDEAMDEITDLKAIIKQSDAKKQIAELRKYIQQRNQSIKVKKIPKNDPRIGLRGQYGVFATERIKRGRVVSLYPGELTLQADPASDSSYSLDLPDKKFRICPKTKRSNDLTAVGDSAAHLINAHTSFGFFAEEKPKAEQNSLYAFFYMKDFRLPVSGVVALDDIEKGAEVLTNYGHDFFLALGETIGLPMPTPCSVAHFEFLRHAGKYRFIDQFHTVASHSELVDKFREADMLWNALCKKAPSESVLLDLESILEKYQFLADFFIKNGPVHEYFKEDMADVNEEIAKVTKAISLTSKHAHYGVAAPFRSCPKLSFGHDEKMVFSG